jgi:hypothetical protein
VATTRVTERLRTTSSLEAAREVDVARRIGTHLGNIPNWGRYIGTKRRPIWKPRRRRWKR